MRKKNGFTLVELLAVIVVLAILMLVAVQNIFPMIANARANSFISTVENIRDSDGIAQNATKVISLRQTGPGLEMGIKKNRDGSTNVKLVYTWDIDTGIFTYIPGENDVNTIRVTSHSANNSSNGSSNNRGNSQGRRTNNDNSLANVQPERKVFADVTSPF